MKTLQMIGTFMQTVDKAFWHEKMDTNRYFATVSVLFALLAGLVSNGDHMGICYWLVESFLKWGIYPSLLAGVGMVFILIILNVCESIIGAKSFVNGLQRSLLVTAVMVLVFILGYMYAPGMTIVLILVTALLVLEILVSLGIAVHKALTA